MLTQVGNILSICLANLCSFRISVQVIVLLSHCQTTLVDADQIVLRIFLIGSNVHAKQARYTLTLHSWPYITQPVLSYLR